MECSGNFQSTFEPMVIINDGKQSLHHQAHHPVELLRKYENREYSPSKDDVKVKSKKARKSSPRAQVRLVSHDEAVKAADTYQKRKSLPLEKCLICKKYFRRMKTHLMKHQLISADPTTVSLACSVCPKAFNTPSNLQIHMRTHTGYKPFVCDVCQKGFSQSCNLVNHMRVHTGEKPFKCPHCDKAFSQSGNLNNHIRLHTEDKPFKCHFCDKAFVQSGNLNSHIKNNHKFSDTSLSADVADRLTSVL